MLRNNIFIILEIKKQLFIMLIFKKLNLIGQSHQMIDIKSFFSKHLSIFSLLLRFLLYIYSLIIIKIKKYACTVSNYWMCLLALRYGSLGMLKEWAIVNQVITYRRAILPAFIYRRERENPKWCNKTINPSTISKN